MATRDRAAALQRIAAALGVPVSGFFEPPGERMDPVGAVELLMLWERIAEETDRARLLTFARALARSDGGGKPM